LSSFAAFLYDGRSAERRVTTAKLAVPGYLVLQELGTVSRFPIAAVQVLPRIGEQPAIVELPEGARLEIADAAAFHAAWAKHSGRRQWVHALESSWPTVLVVLLLTVIFGWVVYDKGIPAASRWAAYAMPVSIDQQIGSEGLTILDEYVFAPSALEAARKAELEGAFQRVVEIVGGDFDYRLEFRDGKRVGANAFALPSGILVFTDQLVELAESNAELEAIMAHEVGHVRNRHSLRMLLQSSVVAGLFAAITGDIAVAGSIAAGVPTLLLQASYSRDFEFEADQFALEYLQATDQPLSSFANIMVRMEVKAKDRPEGFSLLRTHPATAERIAAFRD